MKDIEIIKDEKKENQNKIQYYSDDYNNLIDNSNINVTLIQKPMVSYINNNLNNDFSNDNINDINNDNNNIYKNSYNYLKRYSLDDNNETFKNISDKINSQKEIIYNFGYEKNERLEPLKLCLIEDTINEHEQEYQKLKKERENLKKKFEELYYKDSEKINNNNYIGKNKKSKKNNLNLDTNNNYEYLSRAVEQELNLTNKQMNLLDKEANIKYNQHKNYLKEKNKLLNKNNYQRDNKIFSNQGMNIIKKNKYDNNKNKLNTNKKEIKVPIPLLMSCMLGENKKNNIKPKFSFEYQKQNYFSPMAKKGFNFFLNYNGNYIKQRHLKRNYSEMF